MAITLNKQLHVSVFSTDQLQQVLLMKRRPSRIYIDYHLLLDNSEDITGTIKDLSEGSEIFAALPYMMREEKNLKGPLDIKNIWKSCNSFLKGFLVRNMEELAYLTLNEDGFFDGSIVCDYGIYMWNHGAAKAFFTETGASEGCIPYELNRHEIGEFLSSTKGIFSACLYGYIPMMVSAGCTRKTLDNCTGKMGTNFTSYDIITDRKNNSMKVLTDCRQCLNIIYNSVPLSLHKQAESLSKEKNIAAFRVDLTIESGKEAGAVLNFWESVLYGGSYEIPYKDYTTGHYKRGTE